MSRQFLRQLCRRINKLRLPNHKRRRRNISGSAIGFAPLEPRQLLAVLTTPLTAGANHAVNGQFEDLPAPTTRTFYDNVNGWSVEGSDSGAQLDIIELQGGRGHVLDLDSTAENFDRVFQDIDTIDDTTYILSVDFRGRTVADGADASTNTFEILWGGERVGTYNGTNSWQTAVISVQGSAEDLTRLEFREIAEDGSAGGDGRGALIDNVQVVLATEGGIQNGGFDEFNPEATVDGDTYSPPDVIGWGAMGTDVADRLLKIDTNGGNMSLNLDTTVVHIDRIFQDVTTTAGAQYFLQFDLTAIGNDAAANKLRLRFNDAWAGTFQAENNTQTFGLLLDADSDLTRIVFREVASASNGDGPSIDNVRLFQVNGVTNDLAVDLDPAETGNDVTSLFVEGAGPANILADGVSIAHPGGAGLTAATLTINNRIDGTDEVLSVDIGDTGLLADFDSATGILTITAPEGVRDFTVNDFEELLARVQYENQASVVTTGLRTLSLTVTDGAIATGSQTSDAATINLVTDIDNNLPSITAIADQSANVAATLIVDVEANDIDSGSTLSYAIRSSGTAISGATNQPVISDSGQITWTPSQAGAALITVTVTDNRGESSEGEFTVTVGAFQEFQGNGDLANIGPADRNEIYTAEPPMNITGGNEFTATINTDVGNIVVNLFAGLTPISVNNFVNLARDGYYNGLAFHRVVESARLDANQDPVLDENGDIIFDRFVAQAGDPTLTSSGGPGYTIADEIRSELLFDGPGVLAWAKQASPNTNGSQFFITYDATEFQNDENFTIFGEVIDFGAIIDGENALERIALRNPLDANPATPTTINSITINETA